MVGGGWCGVLPKAFPYFRRNMLNMRFSIPFSPPYNFADRLYPGIASVCLNVRQGSQIPESSTVFTPTKAIPFSNAHTYMAMLQLIFFFQLNFILSLFETRYHSYFHNKKQRKNKILLKKTFNCNTYIRD